MLHFYATLPFYTLMDGPLHPENVALHLTDYQKGGCIIKSLYVKREYTHIPHTAGSLAG